MFYTRMVLKYSMYFRLNIPPFVPARTALEGLESEDLCDNEKPVKNEITDTKVNEQTEMHFSDHQTLCIF